MTIDNLVPDPWPDAISALEVWRQGHLIRSAEAGRLVGFANRGTAEERRQAIKDGLKASREMESEMSDPDRLWEAADRLDAYTSQSRVSPQTAALLRAVAEGVKVWNGYMPDQPTNAKIHKRAFALADAILGDTDE